MTSYASFGSSARTGTLMAQSKKATLLRIPPPGTGCLSPDLFTLSFDQF